MSGDSKTTAAEMAKAILTPVLREVTDWIHGDGERRPKILSQLPNELQSEIALKRAEHRVARGLQAPPPEEKPRGGLVLPAQKSDIKVSTGPKPGA